MQVAANIIFMKYSLDGFSMSLRGYPKKIITTEDTELLAAKLPIHRGFGIIILNTILSIRTLAVE